MERSETGVFMGGGGSTKLKKTIYDSSNRIYVRAPLGRSVEGQGKKVAGTRVFNKIVPEYKFCLEETDENGCTGMAFVFW